jgi:arylsulfatase A-like enzyme
MKHPLSLAILCVLPCLGAALAQPARAAEPLPAPPHRVVVIVFDGMRPDFVTEPTTPNLWKMAQEGVFFAHHHPVYLSSTEVNGTAIATGAYPSHSTIIANVDFRPRIDPQLQIAIEAPANVRRGDDVSGGRYIALPTVAEILHAHGWATDVAGSKQVALLHDRSRRPNEAGVSPVLYEGSALPPMLEAPLVQSLGDFPPIPEDQDKIARDAWTTGALTGTLWKGGLPAYTLLWLSEPDFSQHATGPGSAQSLAAMKGADEDLGRVLAELDRRGLKDTTDVFVVSDHGFSTVASKVDVAVELSLAGFQTGRVALGGLKPGNVMVVSEGGSSLLYIGGHDPDVCRRVAAFVQLQDWCGVVFSRDPLEGTFPLAEAHIDSPEAPDLVVSLRWNREKSATGAPGLLTIDLAPTAKKAGSHASLSAFDMHNTLIGRGPDLKRGVVDTLPTGNTDLAPTVLWLLGLRDEASRMDGRVLGEALSVDAPPLRSYEMRRFEAKRATVGGVWQQYLQVSEVNGVRYLDEGNGAFGLAPR